MTRNVAVQATPTPTPTPTPSPTPTRLPPRLPTPTPTTHPDPDPDSHTDPDSHPTPTPTPDATPTPTPTPPPTGSCNRNATTSSFASEVSAATAGQTICLASGNYGTWQGTNKAITITKAAGAAPTMKISFSSGDSAFTLDGMGGMGGQISGGASNITIRNSTFNSEISVSGTANGANIVFDGNSHNNINGNSTAQRFLAEGGGLTIRNSMFQGGGSDGVRLATSAPVNVIGNTFLNIIDDGSDNHTDNIQWYGGSNAVVRGNLFKQTIGGETQIMGAFDGTGGNLIEDNVVDVISRPWAVELYSDDGSIIRHNTFVYRTGCAYNMSCGLIALDRKTADDAGRNTQVYDNIATGFAIGNGSTASRRDHNMLRSGAGTGDINGAPTFQGGTAPANYAGYRLTTSSEGAGRASDGLNVGARIG